MFPALTGKPSAFMSGLLEFRSPLLITQLGASFEMLCVILTNSQNGEFKVDQKGNATGGLQCEIKRLWLI